MSDVLTPVARACAELIARAKEAVMEAFPESHIRKSVEGHLDHAVAWLPDLERLKGRDQG
jgi:hypothetical protein